LLLVPAAESFLIAFDLNSEREAWRYRLPEGTTLLGAAQAVSAAGEYLLRVSFTTTFTASSLLALLLA